jgi:CRP-like cAMP-binding protein
MASNSNAGEKMRPVPNGRIPGRGSAVRIGSPARYPLPGPHSDLAARVQYFPLFANIAQSDRAHIVAAGRERLLTRGQTIHVEGDDQRLVVLLTSGSAKMTQYGQDGSAVILRLCGAGELVGTIANLPHARSRSTSQALTSCASLIWESNVFESLSDRFPSLRHNVAGILHKQLEEMEDRFREISTECVASRLSRQILRLVERMGTRSNGSIQINITREELGQLIGTTLFTVSRLLSEWDRQGIVRTRREGFSVENLKALAEMID